MWDTTKLGNVLELEYGKGLPKRDRNNEGNYPVYGSNGIVGHHDDYLIDFPCLIVGRKGAAGEVHISKKKCWPIDTTYYVKAPENWNLRFLFYLLKSLKLQQHDRSTAIPGLNRNDAYDLEIPTPPLPIQHRIVEKIEELFSDLDNGIENLKKAKRQLVTYKQSVLKAAFEGKLTKQWREQQDDLPTPAELKQQIEEERKKYREQQLKEWKQEVEEWKEEGGLGRKPWKPRKPKELDPAKEEELSQFDNIPSSWGVEKLGNLFSVHVGSTPKRKVHKYWDGEINWVSSGEVGFTRIKDTKEKITKSGLENSSTDVHPIGTIMLGMIGQGKTRGQAAILDIPAAHNQNTAAIRVPELDYSPELLYYYFYYSYQRTREIGSGNNQKALNKNRVRNIKYLVISPSEQKILIEKIESRLSIVEQVSKTIEQELQKAEALRQSILKKAFEGKLIKE